MTISIAMATYNGEKYIETQLSSLLRQTRPPDEVIIQDDCSTDKTPDMVRGFIAEHGLSSWHFAANEKNQGFVGNFRTALRLATGDLIALCDQDDEWYPEKLAAVESVFARTPDARAVNTSFDFIDREGKVIPASPEKRTANHNLIRRRLTPGELAPVTFPEVIASNISPGCTLTVTRALAREYLARTEGVLPHDWELNLCAARRGGLYFYNVPLIGYRIHGDNAIGLPTKKTDLLHVPARFKDRPIILREQLRQTRFLRDPRITGGATRRQLTALHQFEQYIACRSDALSRRRLAPWLRAWGYLGALRCGRSKVFWKVRSRALLGDLYYLWEERKKHG